MRPHARGKFTERDRSLREITIRDRGIGDRVDRLVGGVCRNLREAASEDDRGLRLARIQPERFAHRRLAFRHAAAAQLEFPERQPQRRIGAGGFR